MFATLVLAALALPPEPFSVDLTRDVPAAARRAPWRVVELPEGWAGQYTIAGDLDGDGDVELLSGRNRDQVMTTLVAVDLDGRVLWRWGEAGAGGVTRFYDVPLQLYDRDGDGKLEVYCGVEGAILVLRASDGEIQRRIPLPEGLRVADCIVFARLSRPGPPRDLVIKDRYHRIWAFDASGKELWRVADPGGYRTCHHPMPLDLDGDGRDELLGGYSLLDAAGQARWTFSSRKTDLRRGHLDCARLVRSAADPERARVAVSCCGANLVALLDGRGRTVWEIGGHHFESIDVGELRRDVEGLEIVVDVDHQPRGHSPLWVISEGGGVLGRYNTNYGRYHHLVDWDGDGEEEIVLANARRIVDARGRVREDLVVPASSREALLGPAGERSNEAPFLLLGNFAGEGKRDIALLSHRVVAIYRNPGPRPPGGGIPLGSRRNFTLY